jgi:ABC-type antimicrobial peptide transport system permease subunit
VGLAVLFAAGALLARSHPAWVTVAALRPLGAAVLCAMVITAGASLFPAWRVTRMTITEALRAQV